MGTTDAMTRERQIVALLTERAGEKLTASEIAAVLKTDVENVRSAMKRLHGRREIGMKFESRTYKVGNSACKHRAALWYVPVEATERAQEARSVSGGVNG